MSELRNPDKLEDVDAEAHADKPDSRAKVDPAWERGDNYYQRSPASRRPGPTHEGDFTPTTWVMIVIAGVVLGFAIAMTFAGA
jgi:hypothetical protein